MCDKTIGQTDAVMDKNGKISESQDNINNKADNIDGSLMMNKILCGAMEESCSNAEINGVPTHNSNRKKKKKNKKNIDLCVPFDAVLESSDESVSSYDDLQMEYTLDTERKRSKVMVDEDYLMEINSNPGCALPIIKFIQFYIENKNMEKVSGIFEQYYTSLCGRDLDDLCIAYVNFLLYVDDRRLIKVVKKLSDICSPRFLEIISANTMNKEVLRIYFSKCPNKISFKSYTEVLFLEGFEKDALKMIEEHSKYLSTGIDLMYKHMDNPRVTVEKFIRKNKHCWIAYLRNEEGEYLRNLYRRVVGMDWNIEDMKEFYRMWLEFEKQSNGNVDEVKERAKEYVESVKMNPDS